MRQFDTEHQYCIKRTYLFCVMQFYMYGSKITVSMLCMSVWVKKNSWRQCWFQGVYRGSKMFPWKISDFIFSLIKKWNFSMEQRVVQGDDILSESIKNCKFHLPETPQSPFPRHRNPSWGKVPEFNTAWGVHFCNNNDNQNIIIKDIIRKFPNKLLYVP